MLATGARDTDLALSPARVRSSMEELSRALDPRKLPAVSSLELSISGADTLLTARLYEPEALVASVSAGLLYFHGGAGVFGSVATHDAMCRVIADEAALRVVSVEYRLAPEAPYPAGSDDAWRALLWICADETRRRLAVDRIVVGGDSAGATLAAMLCQRARAAGAPHITAQFLLCPVLDIASESASRREFAEGYFMSRRVIDWATDLYCPAGVDRTDPKLSPLRAASFEALPEAHVHTAEFDPLLDEGHAYAEALRAAGVVVNYRCHAGLIHHFYCMTGAIPAAAQALKEAARELRESIAGKARRALIAP